jgi:uncharacterized repeat protein (TIGR03809 family)
MIMAQDLAGAGKVNGNGAGGLSFHTDEHARRWVDLTERRRDYLVELYRSGRWRRYFTEVEFLGVMRGVKAEEEAWRTLGNGSDAPGKAG